MTCHQRRVRDAEALIDPRPIASLDGARVVPISRNEAASIILRFEWLKSMPMIGLGYYGLRDASGVLLGAVCFGIGHGTAARNVCGEAWESRTVCLERGACVHWAHPHSASFLIAGACRQAARDYGWRVFFAYSDVEADEIGTVYQAVNWRYIGASVGRKSNYRTCYYSPDGERRLTSRAWRSMCDSTKLSRVEARKYFFSNGWTIGRILDKHKYVGFYGSKTDIKLLNRDCRYPSLPYPKRYPTLTGV